MVAKYRWDFIGLSTFTKPTPATSEKVVNGSTYYCSDTSKLYVWCKDNWYERKPLGGGGSSYTAGTGIDITGTTISVDTDTIQPKLTAGTNITISDENVISASGGGATVVQTTGTSATDVMSQKAVTDTIFVNNNNAQVRIGNTATVGANSVTIGGGCAAEGNRTIALGNNSVALYSHGISLGTGASTGTGAISIGGHGSSNDGALAQGSIAIGYGSKATDVGEMNVGSTDTSYGYNSTNYRKITGVHDGENNNDAVNVSQINSVITAINTALNTNIPTIGS